MIKAVFKNLAFFIEKNALLQRRRGTREKGYFFLIIEVKGLNNKRYITKLTMTSTGLIFMSSSPPYPPPKYDPANNHFNCSL